jgi:hypothetical protein
MPSHQGDGGLVFPQLNKKAMLRLDGDSQAALELTPHCQMLTARRSNYANLFQLDTGTDGGRKGSGQGPRVKQSK